MIIEFPWIPSDWGGFSQNHDCKKPPKTQQINRRTRLSCEDSFPSAWMSRYVEVKYEVPCDQAITGTSDILCKCGKSNAPPQCPVPPKTTQTTTPTPSPNKRIQVVGHWTECGETVFIPFRIWPEVFYVFFFHPRYSRSPRWLSPNDFAERLIICTLFDGLLRAAGITNSKYRIFEGWETTLLPL